MFGVTTANISIHIRDLIASGIPSCERELPVTQKEGARTVSRRIKHFSFQIAHAIALRAQRYEELDWLVDLAKEESVLRPTYKVTAIKERDFSSLLIGALEGLESVLPQYRVGSYIVDFYLPNSRIVVEYDEKHHKGPANRKRDITRQIFIEKKLNARFVRVSHELEIPGLNAVLRQVFLSDKHR